MLLDFIIVKEYTMFVSYADIISGKEKQKCFR